MAEQLTLTIPIVATRTTLSLQTLVLDFPNAVIRAGLTGSDGNDVTVEWTGAAATTLMIALNKANLSTTSLQKRVLQQAVTDGKLTAGTVTGVVL